MAVQNLCTLTNQDSSSVPFIDLSFDVRNSESSVLKLVYTVRPKWKEHSQELKITKFTEGITNTLLKVSRHKPNAPQSEADDNAILMRAYGNRTDLIIDRNREATSHRLLAERGMAPPLLARFKNGLLYGFVPGKVCKAEDLTQEPVWRGVAQKLGEWHAKVPISGISSAPQGTNGTNGHTNGNTNGNHNQSGRNGDCGTTSILETRWPSPNLWSVMQKWINALGSQTEKERARKEMLQSEVERSFRELDSRDGIGEHGFVFAHCDLLCANVIQLQSPHEAPQPNVQPGIQPVTFIDYEYATPAPAAFDVSNHFAEWVGYDCNYNMIPTKSVRYRFLQQYLASYGEHAHCAPDDSAVEDLFQEVNRWRGMPGLYWGIWALIQAKISEIDFDYSTYAEERLGEYFAWRGEVDGTRVQQGKKMPLRERRWAED